MVTDIFTIPLAEGGAEPRCASAAAAPLRGAFLGGPENRLVVAAARDVLDPAAAGGLLVLCGPTGTGKSLLAQGWAAAWRARHGAEGTWVTTAADFARDFAQAVRCESLPQWRQRRRGVRLAVIEDIHHLLGKETAQRELVHLLDEALAEGARIILTARRSPLEETRLAAELRSRLCAGLVVALAPPCAAVRLEALRRAARQHRIDLDDAAARALAEGLPLTVPLLNGALLDLASQTRADGRPLDRSAAEQYVAERTSGRRPTLAVIARLAARRFGVELAALRGPTRQQTAVRARGAAVYLARRLTGESLLAIGRYFGGRDHTTILNAQRKAEQLRRSDPAFRRLLDELLEALEAA